MTQDLIDYSDIENGKSGEFKLPPEKAVMENLTPEQRKMYESFRPPDFNTPFAWAQAPRRMGADKNDDYVYVGDSFGGTLAKINIHTKETKLIPLPNPEADQPYQVAVDKGHHVIAGNSNNIHHRFPRAVFAQRARQNIGEPGAPIINLNPGFLFKGGFDRVQRKDLHGGVEDDFAAFLLCRFDQLGVLGKGRIMRREK